MERAPLVIFARRAQVSPIRTRALLELIIPSRVFMPALSAPSVPWDHSASVPLLRPVHVLPDLTLISQAPRVLDHHRGLPAQLAQLVTRALLAFQTLFHVALDTTRRLVLPCVRCAEQATAVHCLLQC